jgi:hypothetical protein
VLAIKNCIFRRKEVSAMLSLLDESKYVEFAAKVRRTSVAISGLSHPEDFKLVVDAHEDFAGSVRIDPDSQDSSC